MQTPILQESNYKEEMQTIVEPYLVSIGTEFYLERHCRAEDPLYALCSGEPTCGCDVVTWIY